MLGKALGAGGSLVLGEEWGHWILHLEALWQCEQ